MNYPTIWLPLTFKQRRRKDVTTRRTNQWNAQRNSIIHQEKQSNKEDLQLLMVIPGSQGILQISFPGKPITCKCPTFRASYNSSFISFDSHEK
jgi:hypothetical protein